MFSSCSMAADPYSNSITTKQCRKRYHEDNGQYDRKPLDLLLTSPEEQNQCEVRILLPEKALVSDWFRYLGAMNTPYLAPQLATTSMISCSVHLLKQRSGALLHEGYDCKVHRCCSRNTPSQERMLTYIETSASGLQGSFQEACICYSSEEGNTSTYWPVWHSCPQG